MIAGEVKLWGTPVGVVSQQSSETTASFAYYPDFIQSGVEVAPLTMPLSSKIYHFSSLPEDTFHGLPGLFIDSTPDKFGNRIIDAWLAKSGRDINSFTALERLCYTGTRGLGALEYFPKIGPAQRNAKAIDVEQLRILASEILEQRKKVKIKASAQRNFEQMLRVGTSAGGARAKILIAYNKKREPSVRTK